MYRNLIVIASACAICLGVFVAAFTGSARGRADYVFNNQTEPQTLDPTLMSGQPEGEIAFGIFEGLTSYHPETLDPMPGVARSWEVDGLTYTFHLRRDAFWVRGGEIYRVDGRRRRVVAGDFLWTWKRHLQPETGSEYAFVFSSIAGVDEYRREIAAAIADKRDNPPFRDEAFSRLVRIEAPDDDTLRVTLRSPTPYFLYLTSFYALFPVPPEVVTEHGDDWVRPGNIATNGAYWLEEWKFNSHVRLRKNRHYWETEAWTERRIAELRARAPAGALPRLQRLELDLLEDLGAFVPRGLDVIDALAVEELTTSLNLYLNGDVDRIREVAPEVRGDLLELVAADPSALPDLHSGPVNGTYYYIINTTLPVFQGENGRKLRRAMALAMDRRGIVEVVTRGYQTPYRRIVPPGIPGHPDEPLFGSGELDADVVEARRLVAEIRAAGVRIPRLRLLYNTLESHARIAAFVQSGWKRHLGIDVELANQEWGVFLDSRRRTQFDICRAAWLGDYPDPLTFLDLFTTASENNDAKYANPHYDRIVLEYGGQIFEHLSTPERAAAMRADVASWPDWERAIAPRRLEGGALLVETLDEAIARHAALDGEARIESGFAIRGLLFQVAEAMLLWDMPAIPVYAYTMAQLWPADLQGIAMNPRDAHPLKTLRWKDGAASPHASRYHRFPRLSTRPPAESIR